MLNTEGSVLSTLRHVSRCKSANRVQVQGWRILPVCNRFPSWIGFRRGIIDFDRLRLGRRDLVVEGKWGRRSVRRRDLGHGLHFGSAALAGIFARQLLDLYLLDGRFGKVRIIFEEDCGETCSVFLFKAKVEAMALTILRTRH